LLLRDADDVADGTTSLSFRKNIEVSNPVAGVPSIVTRTAFSFKAIGVACRSAGFGGREGEQEARGVKEGDDQRGMVGVASVAALLQDRMILIHSERLLSKVGEHTNSSRQL
jgi:hypothetical protein